MSTDTVINDKAQGGGMPMGMMLVAIAVTVIGAIASFSLLTQGHSAFNTGSTLAWGLPVSAYVFFALSAAGLTMVASVAMVFGVKDFYPIAKRCVWLSIAVLIAGFISLGLELGHPLRMIWAIPLNMAVSSPMFWMGAFYLLFLIFIIWKFMFLQRNDWDSPASRKVGMAGFVAEVAAVVTLGLVFGMMAMRPYWYGAFVPVYFLVTALLSGMAFATLFTYLASGMSTSGFSERKQRLMSTEMPKAFALILGVVLLFHIAHTITGLWSNNPEINAVTSHLVGTLWFHVALWLGLVLPFIILIMPNLRAQPGMQMLAGVLVLLGMFIGRYEYVVGGQLVPLFQGTWHQGLITYAPSMTEWGVVILGTGIGLLIYAYGAGKFRLDDTPSDAN